MMKTDWITQDILDVIRSEYGLDWNGMHGYAHWCRVCENGLLIANENGANRKVVELFAFTHDSKRQDDGGDPLHGLRASRFIKTRLKQYFDITSEELDLLCLACELHTSGKTQGDITIQTYWDADRLDLMRAGIMPAKYLLCTEVARRDEVIQWAVARSNKWTDARYKSLCK